MISIKCIRKIYIILKNVNKTHTNQQEITYIHIKTCTSLVKLISTPAGRSVAACPWAAPSWWWAETLTWPWSCSGCSFILCCVASMFCALPSIVSFVWSINNYIYTPGGHSARACPWAAPSWRWATRPVWPWFCSGCSLAYAPRRKSASQNDCLQIK